MSAAIEPQVVDQQEFIDILDYQFLGDDATVSKKREFINQLREEATVYRAAKLAGVHKCTVYRWREADPQFLEAWDEAMTDAADVMESSVYKQGLNGNILAAFFWLKAYRPKFRDKVTLDIQTVQDEIQERVRLAGLSESALAGLGQPVNSLQFPTPSDNSQKED